MAAMRGAARPAARRLAVPRRVRGTPAETRDRLVAAAAEEFNRAGYHGTDTNRIARAAGYAPGTFYKHFANKRAILLAAYEAWVTTEWRAIETVIADRRGPDETAARIVEAVLAFHRRWRGLRGSLGALVATDAVARAFHRAQRRRQLAAMRFLAGRTSRSARAADAYLLYTLERVCDAIADGEPRALGVDERALVRRLVAAVRDALAGT
jgi:AcrR family transcriptional regulator